MRNTSCLLAVTFGLLLACTGAAFAEEGNKNTGSGKSAAITVDLAEVATVVGLTDKQRPAWDAAVEARNKEVQKFETANADGLAKAQAAARSKDKREQAKGKQMLEQYDNAYQTLVVQQDNTVYNVLSSQQKAVWAGYKINQEVYNEFAGVGLLPDQEQKLKVIADKAGARTPLLYVAANLAVINGVKSEVYNTILTADQRQMYLKLKQQPKDPPKKAGG